MRPINSSSSDCGVGIWRSPIPYIFGSLALLLVFIFVALLIPLCSNRKNDSQSSAEDEEIDSEPKILVIMAGDDKPTYLAKPITSSTNCTCEAEPISSSSSSSEQN
ncbi:protein glutamine dumper 4 [Sesbania bispinosa]|nr:protein glutamine dumper 4 [Sesbania bispinosa]